MEEEKKEETSQEELAKQWEEALSKQKEKSAKEEKPQEAQTSREELSKILERIMDIPLSVEVVVGSTVIQIRDLLNMGPGSVFELDRETTEPVDIKVNGKLIAKGELVVVGEKFGVRITEIYTEERKSVFRDTLQETLKK